MVPFNMDQKTPSVSSDCSLQTTVYKDDGNYCRKQDHGDEIVSHHYDEKKN